MTITISQPCNGFGLTIRGTCPPRVGRVKTRGAAASSGLKPGDCLVKINGRCVLRSDARTVAKLVQQSSRDDRMSFDIIRYETQSQKYLPSLSESAIGTDILEGCTNFKPHFQKKKKKKKRKHSKEEALKRFGNETSGTTAETVLVPKRRGSTLKENLVRIGCRTLPRKTRVQTAAADKDFHQQQPTVSCVHLSSGSYYKWEPEISNIRFEESSSLPDSWMDSQMYSQSSYLELNTARIESGLCIEHSATSVVGLKLHQSISSCMEVEQQKGDMMNSHGEYDILSSHKPNEIIREFLVDNNNNHDNNNFNSVPSDRSTLPISINGNNGILDDISQSVLELEKDFVQHMTNGIQMFTRPLRRAVLSPTEHRSLFQNIEKVST